MATEQIVILSILIVLLITVVIMSPPIEAHQTVLSLRHPLNLLVLQKKGISR